MKKLKRRLQKTAPEKKGGSAGSARLPSPSMVHPPSGSDNLRLVWDSSDDGRFALDAHLNTQVVPVGDFGVAARRRALRGRRSESRVVAAVVNRVHGYAFLSIYYPLISPKEILPAVKHFCH